MLQLLGGSFNLRSLQKVVNQNARVSETSNERPRCIANLARAREIVNQITGMNEGSNHNHRMNDQMRCKFSKRYRNSQSNYRNDEASNQNQGMNDPDALQV